MGFEVEVEGVRVRHGLMGELGVGEIGVEAVCGEEFVVGALFVDPAGFDDEDLEAGCSAVIRR
ncbi:hypothetical protein [Streptomyces sp. NBC_00057]|uniref:hypothetical protein n=1 Tax=Streptomyces sp. NBC_00057 TaxID=2975634 RepID=UPI00324A7705